MRKMTIRLLLPAICAAVLAAVPVVTPAKAAADGSPQTKKHRKPHRSLRVETPKTPGQAQPYYANPADNPDRKVSY
jgi:hypothetical protein